MLAGGNLQPESETRSFPRNWQGVQVGRGLAALMVVAYHAALMLADPRYMGAQVAGGLLRNFNAGVDFFFVLSGFIISWVHWDDIGKPARIPRFLFNAPRASIRPIG
jgi:peptidoglycan/LPS O-acetylase OafA/YrhL